MNTSIKISAVLLLAAQIPGPAHAHEGGKWPCGEDAQKLCKDVEPGEGRIVNCLKEHQSELSDACNSMMEQEGKKWAAYSKDGNSSDKNAKPKDQSYQTCMADKEKFCKDVQPGEGRIVNCLKEHQSELSGTCKSMMEQKRKNWQEYSKNKDHSYQDCMADKEKLCKDVAPGEGRIVKCMNEHASELSPACKAMMAEKKRQEGGKSKAAGKFRNRSKKNDNDEKGSSGDEKNSHDESTENEQD